MTITVSEDGLTPTGPMSATLGFKEQQQQQQEQQQQEQQQHAEEEQPMQALEGRTWSDVSCRRDDTVVLTDVTSSTLLEGKRIFI
jgi:hypothetical protein